MKGDQIKSERGPGTQPEEPLEEKKQKKRAAKLVQLALNYFKININCSKSRRKNSAF
jgi:hypothetical protein